MRRGWIVAPVLALAPAAPAQAASIGRIKAHFVYVETGRLSDDVLRQPELSAWNTGSGGGIAEEPANDVLVLVEVRSETGEAEYIREPLEISIRGEDGRLLARRRIPELFTSEHGSAWNAVWLPDSTCNGRMRIEASVGASRRATPLVLNCGE